MIPDRVMHEDDPNDDGRHDAVNASENYSNEPSKKFSAKIFESKSHVSPKTNKTIVERNLKKRSEFD